MHSNTKAEPGNAGLTVIVSMFEEAEGDRKRMEREMNNSLKFLHDLVKDQQNIIDKQNRTLDAHITIVEEVKSKNLELERRVEELEIILEDCEQYSRANAIEIQGFPEELNKNMYVWVKCATSALGMRIDQITIL